MHMQSCCHSQRHAAPRRTNGRVPRFQVVSRSSVTSVGMCERLTSPGHLAAHPLAHASPATTCQLLYALRASCSSRVPLPSIPPQPIGHTAYIYNYLRSETGCAPYGVLAAPSHIITPQPPPCYSHHAFGCTVALVLPVAAPARGQGRHTPPATGPPFGRGFQQPLLWGELRAR